MKYKIGEVSRLPGISSEGLRLYKRNGVISSEKDSDNGYRYYRHLDISALIRSRTYRNYGFSMKETAQLLNMADLEQVEQMYRKREEELGQEISLLEQKLRYLRQMEDLIAGAEKNLNQCVTEESPGMYRFEFMDQHRIILDDQGKDRFSRWVEMVPFSFLSMRCPLKSLLKQENHIVSALGIMEEYASFLDIGVSEYITYYPPRMSIYTIVKEDRDRFDSVSCFNHVLRYAREQGLKPCGDSIARTFVSLNRKDNYVRYRQVWLPVTSAHAPQTTS